MHRWETTCESFKLTDVTIGPSNLNFPNKSLPEDYLIKVEIYRRGKPPFG